MYDFLVNIGVQPLVANFLVHPEWLHMASAALAVILLIGCAYLLRLDLDPYVEGRYQPFRMVVERIAFYAALVMVLGWTYWYPWKLPEPPPEGFYINKFTVGGILVYVLVLGRCVIHWIYTERARWDFFDRFPYYVLLLFQFFVPLVYYFRLERNGLMPKEELGFALAVVLLGYIAIRTLLGRPTYLPRNPVAPWVWLFLGYILLTLLIFPYRLAAIKNIIQWIAFATIFFVSLAYVPDRRSRDVVIMAAIMASLVSTVWGMWKYFDGPAHLGLSTGTYPSDYPTAALRGKPYYFRTPSAGRYFLLAGFFANPNYYGEYLTMVIYCSLGLLFASDSKWLRGFLAVVLGINVFEMVALYNRAGWFGNFVAVAFVLGGAALARLPVLKRVSVRALAAGVAGLLVLLMLTGAVFNRREKDDTPLALTPYERLKSMTDFEKDETFRNRLTMWRAAYLMLKDPQTFPERLIFGAGLGFFEVNYLPYQTKVLETYDFNEWFHNVIPTFRAHNDHLQMLVEAGVIGTGLYLLIFVTFFGYGFRFLREEEEAGRRFMALGIMASTASMLAIAFFSFPFHQIEHGGFLFAVMGFLIAEIAERRRRKEEALLVSSAVSEKPEEVRHAKKKKVRGKASQEMQVEVRPLQVGETYPLKYFIHIQKKFHPLVYVPGILLTLFIVVWGAYTQIINLKSQYLVVKGIDTLRAMDSSMPENQRRAFAQIAADLFWKAYKLDPTNGRAEFFHGFALIKKNTYEDVVEGIRHLQEGQLLYPQSDTYYALAMGWEARRQFAEEAAAKATDPEEKKRYEDDALLSHNEAIKAYMTAAQYYPVKVEYYKELIRLLEEQGRYEEMIYWADRAVVVWDWLAEKPKIKWQLLLWKGKALRALGAQAMQEGDEETGLRYWGEAEKVLLQAKELSNAVYYAYYELGQIYEALGMLASRKGDEEEAQRRLIQARDMYVEAFSRRNNVGSGQAPFDYAYFLLGRVYEELGDKEKALDYYRRLMTESYYSPNTQTYQRARNRIYELTGRWEGEAPSGEVTSESKYDEPVSWLSPHT